MIYVKFEEENTFSGGRFMGMLFLQAHNSLSANGQHK